MPPAATWRVLLVDDSAGDLLITTKAIERHRPPEVKVQISSADTLAAAGQALRSNTFDCVVLDLRLPGSVGVTGIDRLLGVAPDTPIVVLSGSDLPAARERCLASGAKAYVLKKPLSQAHDIAAAIAAVID